MWCVGKEEGFRGKGHEQIAPVETHRQAAHQILFRIGDSAGRLIMGPGEILAIAFSFDSHPNTGFERAHINRHGATAGLAGEADALRIHFRAGEQVVDGSNRVPRPVLGQRRSQKQKRVAGLEVLAGGSKARQPCVRVEILLPLALAERVKGQNHESVASQRLEDILIIAVGFAEGRVTHGGDDRGKGALPAFGNVKVRRDIDLRQAFEDYLIDPIGRPLDGAHHLGVQRGAFQAAANGFPNFGAGHFTSRLDLGGGRERGQRGPTPGARIINGCAEVSRPVVPVVPPAGRRCRLRDRGSCLSCLTRSNPLESGQGKGCGIGL